MVTHPPKVCMKERARDFALKITEYQPHKLAAKSLDIAPDTVRAIRSYHTPGKRLLQRWKAKFGPAFTDFVEGKHDNVKIAALEARLAEIKKELEEARGAGS